MYQEKYLKYKQKYTELKKLFDQKGGMGGGMGDEIFNKILILVDGKLLKPRDYQLWALKDYIKNKSARVVHYKSKNTYAVNDEIKNATVIEVSPLDAGIIFKIYSNADGNIVMERIDKSVYFFYLQINREIKEFDANVNICLKNGENLIEADSVDKENLRLFLRNGKILHRYQKGEITFQISVKNDILILKNIATNLEYECYIKLKKDYVNSEHTVPKPHLNYAPAAPAPAVPAPAALAPAVPAPAAPAPAVPAPAVPAPAVPAPAVPNPAPNPAPNPMLLAYNSSHSSSWFKKVFHIDEPSYSSAKAFFNNPLNSKYIQSNFTLNELEIQIQNNGPLTFENITNTSVITLHSDIRCAQSTFQVASQLNCLEMKNPGVSPESGITNYYSDRTQGPGCVLCTPYSLAYRNYNINVRDVYLEQLAYVKCILDEYCYHFPDANINAHEYVKTLYKNIKSIMDTDGQTHDIQLDSSYFFKFFIDENSSRDFWNIYNGYLMFKREQDLKDLNTKLRELGFNKLSILKKLILSGVQNNNLVCINGAKYNYTVNHVLCSGLPIDYDHKITNKFLWYGLSELFLDAMYLNTLKQAYANNVKNRVNQPCFLTLVGGGAFGMEHYQIARAIHNACLEMKNANMKLDVKLVHYGGISHPAYNNVNKKPEYIRSCFQGWDLNRKEDMNQYIAYLQNFFR